MNNSACGDVQSVAMINSTFSLAGKLVSMSYNFVAESATGLETYFVAATDDSNGCKIGFIFGLSGGMILL